MNQGCIGLPHLFIRTPILIKTGLVASFESYKDWRLYLTNLIDEQWQLLCPVLEIVRDLQKGGRPRNYPLREIVNGILYITKTGCQWRML
ncbi:MAG: transposase, partial [Patescibacteria group bacterium]|nr:transposase [Patescibacteria group bacterium]